MTSTLLEMLPAAAAFALSPLGLVAMMLVLLSRNPRRNGLVFLAALLVPVFGVTCLSALRTDAADASGAGMSTTQAWVVLVVAAVLAVGAVHSFVHRRDPTPPAFFARVEGMGPAAMVLVAPIESVVNPKNLVVLLGAGSIAGRSGHPPSQLVVLTAAFTVVATLPFLALIGYMAVGGARAASDVARWKEWLLRYNRWTMAVLLAAIAVVLAVPAVAALR